MKKIKFKNNGKHFEIIPAEIGSVFFDNNQLFMLKIDKNNKYVWSECLSPYTYDVYEEKYTHNKYKWNTIIEALEYAYIEIGDNIYIDDDEVKYNKFCYWLIEESENNK